MLIISTAFINLRPRFASSAVVLALAVLVSQSAFAQNLPPPSRTVYKCDVAGKMVYSDSPCLGAVKIDVEPTRGLNKSSGRELVGTDVRREQHRETIAEAVRPITGMDTKQFEVQSRRMKLSSDAQQECRRLDRDIAATENEEKRLAQSALTEMQRSLFTMRRRVRELGC
jgi:hypothetical protein